MLHVPDAKFRYAAGAVGETSQTKTKSGKKERKKERKRKEERGKKRETAFFGF